VARAIVAGRSLIIALREPYYPQWFGSNLSLTWNPDFDSVGRFAPKRRSSLRKRRESALRIKFEDNPNASSGLDPKGPAQAENLKDL
jgi:hypothetical protein